MKDKDRADYQPFIRKIVQIAIEPRIEGSDGEVSSTFDLWALCNDGTILMESSKNSRAWEVYAMEPVPQPEKETSK